MKLEQFEIKKTFVASAGFEWLCTDKGTRTITAIMLDTDKDTSWFIGPPYAVEEVVFDEYDMKSCYPSQNDMLTDRMENSSAHPGFLSEDIFKMMDEMTDADKYLKKNILKIDRVGKNGDILHPYSAHKKDDGWYIKSFELFSREYSEMHEDEFVKLSLSNEDFLKIRKENFNKK